MKVYRTFAQTGRPPTVEGLADEVAGETTEIRAALRQLARGRHLSLDVDDAIVMAHPFSAVPLGFSVMSNDTLWWGGCAWDSFALPHLLGELLPGAAQVLVATTCPACNRPHAWSVDRGGPPDGEQVAHFLVPAAHMWEDVVHTCGHQRLFCSTSCVEAWLARTGNDRGYVMECQPCGGWPPIGTTADSSTATPAANPPTRPTTCAPLASQAHSGGSSERPDLSTACSGNATR